MEENLKELRKRIEGPLKDLNIIVDSVSFEKQGNYNNLLVILDRVNGLDLDTIVKATNIINPIVDEFDFIDDSFILDVSSKEKGE